VKDVRSVEARIGARVRVVESELRTEWRGLTGRISGRWGHPSTWPSTCAWRMDARSCSGTTSWRKFRSGTPTALREKAA
jgi:hypothetical protein